MQFDPNFRLYLDQIKSYSLLTHAQEQELAQRLIRDNDLAARDEMVRGNLRLVVRIAKAYSSRGMSVQDLIQEGNIGLLKAVENFNPGMNIRLTTYACWWIKRAMRRALHEFADPFRIPEYMIKMIARWKGATAELKAQLARDPFFEEITLHLDLSAKAGRIVYRAVVDVGSAEERKVPGNYVQSMSDLLRIEESSGPEEAVLKQDQIQTLNFLLDGISTREAEILRWRFGLEDGTPRSFHQIAEDLGLTPERVHRITNEALERLNVYLARDRIPLFAETATMNGDHSAPHRLAAQRA